MLCQNALLLNTYSLYLVSKLSIPSFVIFFLCPNKYFILPEVPFRFSVMLALVGHC